MEIQVMKNILGENDRVAAENQAMFAEKGVYVLNLMGSPGAGKTSLLEKTLEKLKDKVNKGRPLYKQIVRIKLRDEEFIKNASMKIVRHKNIFKTKVDREDFPE